MYVAEHYVKLNGRLYVPGEVIEETLSAGERKWLLGVHAIFEDRPSPEEQTEPSERADKSAEPEIDVMEGIVSPEKKTGRRKTK